MQRGTTCCISNGECEVNTQTHLLLSAALLARSRGETVVTPHPAHNPVVLLGALLPDLSLFVMWAAAKLGNVPDRLIWSEWYYSAFWQQAGAMTNSIPLYLALLIFAMWAGAGWRLQTIDSDAGSFILAVFALAALSHVATDFPLHHDDGHPHFWPLSQWIFASPVSYWDPAHYGHIWSIIEIALGIALVLVLWRRFGSVWVRSMLVSALLSFGIIAGYWYWTLG